MQKGHKIFIKTYVFLFICVLYISFSEKLNRNIVTTPFAYYNFLLDAFFHGYAHIISYVTYDLSLFHGNWYLYWGPAPVLFILPFFTIAGISASDVFYTLFAGIINIFLFYFVLKEAETYFQYTLSFFSELFLIIGFSICSPNFLLSLTGNIWGTSQIVAALYLLLSYFFYFRFLNKKRKIFFLLAIVFFNLAWLSRYTMFFGILLFLFPVFQEKKRSLYKYMLVISIGVTTLCMLIFLLYNFLRFANPFETGMKYVKGSGRYNALTQQDKLISLTYMPHNMYYYFLNVVQFIPNSPFVKVNKEGNSIFSVYPAICFLFLFSVYRKKKKEWYVFIGLAIATILITLVFFLCYFATGWTQFGIRYFLDITPLVYLLLMFIIEDIPKEITTGVLLYGILVNILGVYSFFFYQ